MLFIYYFHAAKVDDRPIDIHIDKPFGKFAVSTVVKGDKLTFKRSLQLTEGTYSKDDYHDLVTFYQTVYEADNYNITLIKN